MRVLGIVACDHKGFATPKTKASNSRYHLDNKKREDEILGFWDFTGRFHPESRFKVIVVSFCCVRCKDL